ncbi:MAG: polymer-forming cytoskeletal protein [Polyangia bacterium]
MTEPITIIGTNTFVNGNLEGDEDLTIEGRVEGAIALSKTLTVEVGGVVHANINVRNAIISGVLVGNVEAQESVHITEEGRVVGDISSPRVILVDGSSFRGNIDMGEFDIERESAAPAVEHPATPRREADQEPEEAPRARPVSRPAPARKSASSSRPAASKSSRKSSSSKTKKKKPPAPKARSVGRSKGKKKKRG